MTTENDDQKNKSELSGLKKYSYLISIVVAFMAPLAALYPFFKKYVPKAPFFISSLIIAVIGWAWSWTVSSHNWWTFGQDFLTGFQLIPNLPIEEVLFYPLGGMLCILIYTRVQKMSSIMVKTNTLIYWTFVVSGSAAFGLVAWMTRANHPLYIISQLLVYNVLCSLLLAPWAARDVRLLSLLVPIFILTVVGYSWNYVGFKYGWWVYNATTGITIGIVPFDDCNFYLFAPTAAISIYVFICRVLNSPQLRSE